MIIIYNHRWLFWPFYTFWEQFMGIPGNALSIRAVYWRKMAQNIGNIDILWAFNWLNELRLKDSGCIIYYPTYFANEIDMHYAADCIAQKPIFHVFDWKIKSRAVRKPLTSQQERCLAPRNSYAARLRPGTVTIHQRDHGYHKIQVCLCSIFLSQCHHFLAWLKSWNIFRVLSRKDTARNRVNYRQKIWIFGKHCRNSRIWYFYLRKSLGTNHRLVLWLQCNSHG